MNRTFRRISATLGTLVIVLLSSCAANPKKKCDTCPKWRSEVPAAGHEFSTVA